MLLLFLFALLLFVCFICLLFNIYFIFTIFRDNNMISISTVQFRYYVAIILLVNLGKPISYKGLRQLKLISFQ